MLNASSNLVGFCFLVMTSIKLFGLSPKSLIDEITVLVLLLFMASAFFSFLVIKVDSPKALIYYKTASFTFISGMALLLITTLLFTFDFFS
jgi:hypothetical protein